MSDMTTKQLIRAQLPLREVENLRNQGRISAKVFRQYMFLWTWGAARFDGIAGQKRERVYSVLGAEALWRRTAKVKDIIDWMQA